MTKRLTIISQGKKDSGLYINNGNISYISDNKVVTLNNYPSNEKPLFLSELSKRLKYRNWCIPETKAVGRILSTATSGGGGNGRRPFMKITYVLSIIKDGLSYNKLDTTNNVKNLSWNEEEEEILKTPITDLSEEFSSGEELKKLLELQKTVQEMKETDGKTFYNSSKIIVDFLSKSISIDLMTDDSYTNTVSLVPIIEHQKTPGLTAKADLSIKYSKGNETCASDLTFEAFRYIGSTLSTKNYVRDINSEVLVEYLDGVIRVIPKSSQINECIISNCVVTYGCL